MRSAIQLGLKHQKQIEAKMEQLLSEFNTRSWPTKKRRSVSGICSYCFVKLIGMKPFLAERTKTRCRGDCTCSTFAQCQQNAHSYIKTSKYMAECDAVPHNIPTLKGGKVTRQCHNKHSCASAGARHQVIK
jgi:hypothetical protein